MDTIANDAEVISMFCRINLNTKKNLPIRSSEMGLLIYIVKSGIPPTPIEVADFFKITKPMVTTMIKSMLTQEYLVKKHSETDKRSFYLVPTPKAITLVEDAYSEYHKTMELLENKMGNENYKDLVALLAQANQILLDEKQNG